MTSVTIRRPLGAGPEAPAQIRAAQADLLDSVPGVRLPDVGELRARGALSTFQPTPPTSRRTLGVGGRVDEESPA